MNDMAGVHEECARGRPHIGRGPDYLGGAPHVSGTDLKVSAILARLRIHGSVAAVVGYYQDVTVDQVKDALAYAHRFMELACACPPARPGG